MEIDGPLSIKVANEPDRSGYQLFVDFTPDFRAAGLAEQGARFRDYRRTLEEGIAGLPHGDRNRDGMAIVLQLVDALMPHVESGELDLSETMVIDIGGAPPEVDLTDLLRDG